MAVAVIRGGSQPLGSKMSRLSCVLALLACLAAPAAANPYPEDARLVSAEELASNPDAFKREAIRVRHVRCGDVPSGFLCQTPVKAYLLRIDALLLGTLTSEKSSERLAETCKGEAAFATKACEFEVEFIPQSSEAGAENGATVVTVKTREIDML